METSTFWLYSMVAVAVGLSVHQATQSEELGFAAGAAIAMLVLLTDQICRAIKQQTKTLLNHQTKK